MAIIKESARNQVVVGEMQSIAILHWDRTSNFVFAVEASNNKCIISAYINKQTLKTIDQKHKFSLSRCGSN
jgi:hypothetical protein